MRIDAYTHFIPKRFFEEVLGPAITRTSASAFVASPRSTISRAQRNKIYCKNLEKLVGRELVNANAVA